HVQCDGSGRDDRDRLTGLVAETHHRAFAIALFDLGHRQFESLLAVGGLRHGASPIVGVRLTGIGRLSVTLERATDKLAGRTLTTVAEQVFDSSSTRHAHHIAKGLHQNRWTFRRSCPKSRLMADSSP